MNVVGGEISRADLEPAVLFDAGGDGVEAVDGGERFEAIDVDYFFKVFENGWPTRAMAKSADGDVVRAFGEIGGVDRLLIEAIPIDGGEAGVVRGEKIFEAIGDRRRVGEISLAVAVGIEAIVDF